ncbi:uncharacterized protein [Diadema antillarum]|uniref:uncharacterized protein n=1 Tax=Diadema antillarum TaxID=105358 RepID=UPI003A854093
MQSSRFYPLFRGTFSLLRAGNKAGGTRSRYVSLASYRTSNAVPQSRLWISQELGSQNVWTNPRLQSFSTSRAVLCDAQKISPIEKQAATKEPVTRVQGSPQHEHFGARATSNFDKRLLVFFGKYKTVGEVPDTVSVHLVNSIRNKFRIYVNIFIGILTMLGCVAMIYRGHQRAGKGETLAEQNMRRHPDHYKKQQEA